MIQSIALINFQSHCLTLLEFDPGVNVIVGDSDSGKTSILRALNWVLTNRPTGEAFRRDSSSSTSVTVDTSDGAITRVRSDRENLYFGPSAGKLAAIGTSVPELVLKLLKMDSDISLQRQLDAPFLLSCSPGEVAQRLNSSVGLDEIDVGLANVARRVRQNQSAFSEIDMRCKELSERVQSFAYLVDMEQAVRLVEDLFVCYSELVDEQDSLSGHIQEGKTCVSSLSEFPDVDGILPCISEAECLLIQRVKQMTVLQNLLVVISEIKDVMEVIDNIPDVSELILDCEAALFGAKQLVELKQATFQLQVAIKDTANTDKDLQEVRAILAREEEQFHKQFPSVCPLCGRKGRK